LAIELFEGENMKTVERKSLVGERVILRPFNKSDLPHIQRWSTDAELRKLTGERLPPSAKQTLRNGTENCVLTRTEHGSPLS
jgi:hypothetical protein